MRLWRFVVPIVVALAVVLAVNIATPKASEAFIDEIIAALCNGKGPVEPPGQVPGGPSKGNSTVRALQATGFIQSIVFDPGVSLTINFNPDVPNSKFIDAGVGDVVINPTGGPGGVPLIASPGIIPDPNFPAHANCKNLNP